MSSKKDTNELDIKLKFDMGTGDGPPSTLKDVELMYKKSRENREAIIEWAWTERSSGKTFRLEVIYPFVQESNWWDYERKDDPTWRLFEDTAQGNPVLWEYKSGDFQLALEIVQMVCARESRAASTVSNAAAVQRTPVFADSLLDMSQCPQLTAGMNNPKDIGVVLRSFAAGGYNGLLEIGTNCDVGQLFFENGMLVHATTIDSTGDSAVRELVSQQVGQVLNIPDQKSEFKSITRHVEHLVREGQSLLEHKRYLAQIGLSYGSYLASNTLNQYQITALLPTDLHRRVHAYFAHPRMLADFLRDFRLETYDWVPLFVNLLSRQLVRIEPAPATRADALACLDGSIEEQLSQLLSPQTGVLKHYSLLLLLQREFLLHKRMKAPLSLIVFDIQTGRVNVPGKPRWLSAPVVKLVAQKVELLKRPVDIFTHFESLDYAVVLPNTDLAQATAMARIVMQDLTAAPLQESPDRITLDVVCGIASFPSHGDDLRRFVACAKLAKNQAKKRRLPLLIGSLEQLGAAEAEEAEEERKQKARAENSLRPPRTPAETMSQSHLEPESSQRPFELQELLIRAELVTPAQIQQAHQLMKRLAMPLSIDRVLAMEGHIQPKTVRSAAEIHVLVQSGELTMDQAVKAAQMVGKHGLDVDTVLKRMGLVRTKSANALATLLEESMLVPKDLLEKALLESGKTGLSLGYVLTSLGFLSGTLLEDALTALSLTKSETIARETGVDALRRKVPLDQALRDYGVDIQAMKPASPLERLLESARIMSKTDLLTAHERAVVDEKEFEATLQDCGIANAASLEAAKTLLCLVDRGDISAEYSAQILGNIKDKGAVPDLSELISTLNSSDANHATTALNLAPEQQRLVVKFCKEHKINYLEGLELFGWTA